MDEESIGKVALHSIYPAKGPVTEQQVEEDLEQGKIYRLNDRFFKFLFGREERKHPVSYTHLTLPTNSRV